MEFSREFGLTPNIIEKDYLLGWLLAGISNHPELGQSWIFKGGTCLKKCYFETYRFSEDLDFTLARAEHQDKDFLIGAFKKIANWIYDAAGIEIPRESIRFDLNTNPRGKISVEGRIYYKGPLGFAGPLPRIKLDLTADEILVLNQVSREVNHPYSDKPAGGIHFKCYGFEELFAEKVRALGERLRPRDLYDVVHLYRHFGTGQNRELVLSTLKKKCEFKEIPLPVMETLEGKPERAELVSEWNSMLGHQVPVLPPFEQFWQELPELFDWLYRAVEKAAPASMPAIKGEDIDTTWHPPAMAQAWHMAIPLEVIRYAATNRLIVDLAYGGSRRLIEPYSLKRTREGNLLLHAVKHESGESRSYRVDRIEGAKVTQRSFRPKYAIELTIKEPYQALPTSKRSAWIKPISRLHDSGPKYIFKCSLCGKRFTKKSFDATLKNHKNKFGHPCPSQIGLYVATKY